ncbi:MAG: amino acid-binding protein [Verrucomicrobia bacterium]|nr:amino acid-binding protein [Verrucomicrobiota bacterium]
MKLNQLSVFLENKPGALSTPCRLLAKAGVNIQTFALADTQQFGILRLMVHDWAKAKELLEKNGYVVKTTEVVALEVPDSPGGLADILEIVEAAKVNVEYMYAFTVKQGGEGLLAFRFDNPDAAIKALQARKINVVGNLELVKRLGD